MYPLLRPICCVDIACNAKVPFCKMIDHMSKDHEAGDFVHANGSKYQVSHNSDSGRGEKVNDIFVFFFFFQSYFIVNDDDFSREIMWISDHLSLDGLHFFRECCRSAEGQWHVWVYLLGTPAEAAAYRATVRIFLPGGGGAGTAAGAADEEEMAYRGRVNALNSPARERPDEVAGLTFPDFVAKRFWKNKQIHYDVAVERRQPLYAAAPASRKERSSAGGGKERSGKSSSSSAKSTSGLVKGEADCSAGKTEQGSTREGADGEETAQAAQLAQAAKGGEEGGKTRKKKSASTGGGQGKDANGKEGNGKKEDVKETSC